MRTGCWLVAALVCAGCSGLEEPERITTGILHLFSQGDGAGGFQGRPEAMFLSAPPSVFPDSRMPADRCQLADVVNLPVGTVDNLDAGDSIAFTNDAATTYLYPKLDLAGNESYSPAISSVSLTPGGPITFAIPGAVNGFPAVTFTAISAPAVTQLSPIRTAVSVSDSLVVTWAPAGDDSSSFEVALQFASEGANVANRQVLCEWRDDGRGVIAGSLLSEWSTTGVRRIEASRYRTFRQDLAGSGLLYFLATYDLTPEPAP